MSRHMQHLVIDLKEPVSLGSVGGKAANLAQVMQQGLSVPPSVVVTRECLRLFLEESGLLAGVHALVDGLARNAELSNEEYRSLSAQIMAAPIPSEVAAAAKPHIEQLLAGSPNGLAVRSSGISEDTAEASFAGVYESHLGVHAEADIWRAVRRCWCAAWAPSALAYARRMGIAPEVDGMAVLLQRLIPADSAGVLFTADPLTGNPWRFVLESSFGLASGWIASAGEVPVDRFHFMWDTGEILQREIATKQTMHAATGSGVESRSLDEDRQTLPSLDERLASEIAQLGLSIDRAFRTRVDIEWVVEGDSIHVVQVRPLTALPEFFPHHLPSHLARRRWGLCPTNWRFALKTDDAPAILPIYRDKLISEQTTRYLDLGYTQTPDERRFGSELQLNGHRYQLHAEGTTWPWVPDAMLEPFLLEREPALRADFLYKSNTQYTNLEQMALRLEGEPANLARAIESILWVRDELWDIVAVGAGPSQHLCHICRRLLNDLVTEYLPDVDVDDLTLGHHDDLDPYRPHELMDSAACLAKLLEPERDRLADLSLDELANTLGSGHVSEEFVSSYEDWCDSIAVLPPWRLLAEGDGVEQILKWHSMQMLRLVRSALRGGPSIQEIATDATRRREEAVTRAREQLAGRSSELARFERVHDWALFWGPALNHRILRTNAPLCMLQRLFKRMRIVLLESGLIDDVEDAVYFTVDDLRYIADTGDIATGRRLLRDRRLEFERCSRLSAPSSIGASAPERPSPSVHVAPTGRVGETMSVIQGLPEGPGHSHGVICRVQSLAEADDRGGDHDVVVLLNPERSNNNHVPLVFSMLLRVKGLVVPHASGMWTGHISQIARECRVPVVRIRPPDLDRLSDGQRVEIDGGQGTLTLL